MVTSLGSWISCIVALASLFVVGTGYLLTLGSKVRRIRSVFLRACLEIRAGEFAQPGHLDYRTFRAGFHPDTAALTAIEFLTDLDGHRSILQRADDLSTSLFANKVMTLIFTAHALALFYAPVVGSVLYVLWGETIAVKFSKGDPHEFWGLTVMGAAGVGVVLSALTCIVLWKLIYDKNAEELKAAVEDRPIWTPGPVRSPKSRKLREANKDPAFRGLGKASN